VILLGGTIVELIHRKISGPQPEDALEEEAIRRLIEETHSSITWVDRVTYLCFAVGFVMLLVLALR
jgi:hypothetical protein